MFTRYTKLLFLVVLIIACSDDSSGNDGEKENEQTYIKSGWDKFDIKDYPEAILDFKKALDFGNELAEIYYGLGWSYLMNNELGKAELLLENKPQHKDLDALRIFIFLNKKDYVSVVSRVNFYIGFHTEWSFDHGLSLAFSDIYLAGAQAAYLEADYAESLGFLKKIDSQINYDINSYDGIKQLGDKIAELNK
jgi:tetratricopeptide (TPR) repeat protein